MRTRTHTHVEADRQAHEPGLPTPTESRVEVLVLLAAVLLVGLYLVAPVLSSGYSGDDVPNSQIPMAMQAQGFGLWDYVTGQSSYWTEQFGRLFPMSIAQTALIFMVFGTRASYKAFQVAAVLGNLAMLVVLTRQVLGSWRAGLLTGGVAALALQIRHFHDPILQFSAQQPIVVALLLGALLTFHRALALRRWWWLGLAGVLWVSALLTYETTYLLAPAFLVIALTTKRPWRDRALAVGSMAAPVIGLGLVVVSLRRAAESFNPAYALNLDPGPMLVTFAYQVSAAFPMSYSLLSRPEDVALRPAEAALDLGGLVGVLAVAAAAALFAWLLVHADRVPRPRLAAMAVTGAGLWIAPALLIAATLRWQQELPPGIGYVSVYLQYFGVAMILGSGLWWLAGRLGERPSRTGLVAFAVVAGLVAGLTVTVTATNNERAVRAYDYLLHPRVLFENAVQRGAFSEVPDEARLQNLSGAPWVTRPLIHWFSGPFVNVEGGPLPAEVAAGCAALDERCFAEQEPLYVVAHDSAEAGRGTLRLARVEAAVPAGDGTLEGLGRRALLYVEDPGLEDPGARLSPLLAIVDAERRDPHLARPAGDDEATVLQRGEGWVLIEIRVLEGFLVPAVLTAEITLP